ncbi:siderophore-interacting protein [Kineosporia rhizophila]|uniref:siderophore-interacting protein n=1 Tax=Kineosporia TaxID=49184 RepID=UPI001E57B22D|nr:MULTISPECIES: siderophore-interacting protein [Kineosporia]MCE0538242.1 siderophore-interacting protein [Kineosporia rhizophila]GLY15081.1 siderophore-interacting protein [Kineosporia sp. NBRC 101677]
MTAREFGAFTGQNLTGKLQFSWMERIDSRDVQVVRFEDVTPRYRRVVVGGESLADFPWAHFSAPDHVKVFFPHPESGELVSSRQGEDEWYVTGGSTDPIHRDYTVRAFDAEKQELTLDFVVHDHGVAGRWVADVKVGDPLVLNGPSANWLLPENYPHFLALGDEPALPAIARIIEEAPAGSRVTALIEVQDASDEQPLSGKADLDLRWIHRSTAPVGEGDLSPLETALRALDLPEDRSTVFVFAAGETNRIKPIRRYLRRDLGLPKEQLIVDGYWKQGVVNFDHHDNELDED